MTLLENYIYDIISQNEVINEDIRYEITSDLMLKTSFIRAKEEAGTINIAYSDKISIPF